MLFRSYGTTVIAARYGYVELLDWLVRNGGPWHPNTLRTAIVEEDLGVLCWIRDHQDEIPGMTFSLKRIAKMAIYGDYLRVLEWCGEQEGFFLDTWVWRKAVKRESLGVLHWLWKRKVPCDRDTLAMANAVRHKCEVDPVDWIIPSP